MVASGAHAGIVEQQRRGKAPRDERDWGVFWKAAAIGASVPCFLAASWLMLLASFADQGMWYPKRPEEWQAAGLFLFGLIVQIANIATAWMTPAYADDLLDEE